MYVLFIVLTVIVAVMLIGIVLIQKSKGGGLSSQFGGGNQVLGVRGTNSFLEKTTWTLAVLILVFSVASAYTLPQIGEGETKQMRTESAAPQQQNAQGVYGNQPAPGAAQQAPAPTGEQPLKTAQQVTE